jgi:hypothetical protein
MERLYLVFGVLVLAAMTYADYRGVSFTSYDEVKNVPKSIRNNPGAYRGAYRQGYFHK